MGPRPRTLIFGLGLRTTYRPQGFKTLNRPAKNLKRMDRTTEESSTNLLQTGVSVPFSGAEDNGGTVPQKRKSKQYPRTEPRFL